jgi:competence protein ComFC
MVYSLWKYTPPARKLLHRIKYRREPYWLEAFLSTKNERLFWLGKRSLELVCVPPRLMGWLSRGFHLPHLLAKELALTYSFRYRRDILQRKVLSRPQVGLRKRERAENVRGQYTVNKKRDLSGTNLLLVDDVMTTGSTLAECAEVLLEEGAASVTAWTLFQAVTGQTRQ